MRDFLGVTLVVIGVLVYGKAKECVGYVRGVRDHKNYIERHQEDD